MKFAEFSEKINAEYAKRFPGSMCYVNLYGCFGKSIDIAFYLAESKDELSNGYLENDMFRCSLTVPLPNKFNVDTDELPDVMTMEKTGNHFNIKPENEYMCYGVHTVNFRKTNGNSEKLIVAAGKFMDKILDAVLEAYKNGKIHPNYLAMVERKIKA